MKNLFLLATLITGLPTHSQTLRYSSVSTFPGRGTYSDRFTDAFSVTANPASLATLPELMAGVYAERKFLIAELNQYTGIAGIPLNKGGIGMIMNWYGFTGFNESKLGLAYGKQLGKVNMGIQFNYHRVRIAGYGSDAAITMELGSTWHISEKLYCGIHIVNPVGGNYTKNAEEKIASAYTLGMGYEASDQVFLSMAIVKEEAQPVTILAGIQYVIDEKLFTSFGISTVTTSPFFSAGWKWKNCRADVTASYHPQLGITPGLMILFFGKKQQGKEVKNEER